jgi:GT2 family glycosyltransferase
MSQSPDVSVVIPIFNHVHGLDGLLDALAAQTLDPDRFEVTIVDNYSTDGTWDALVARAAEGSLRFRLLRTSFNGGGPATPRNLGWRASRAPIVAFMDDDCHPTADWLESGLAAMVANPRLGVMQGCTLTPPEIDVNRLDCWHVWRLITEAGPLFEGVNIFYRRAALDATGGFNEDIAFWGEDTDLGWKVVEAGWERGFSRQAVVVHDVERRDWRWWIRIAWSDGYLVRLAAIHPQFRAEAFWRPWSLRREDAALLAAIVGATAARRWKPAVLLAIPYLWWQRPPVRNGPLVSQGVKMLATDLTRLASHLGASISSRTLVL